MSFKNLKNQYQNKIHFIGIGGIGMSAIALILKKIGLKVQGSDLGNSNNIKNLEDNSIKCFVGHKSENITEDIDVVVKTSIIKDANPEIIKAKEKNLPIIRRADMLAQIMKEKIGITIAGTHGKTSTTAMVSILLEEAKKDPIVINGGIINYYGSNAKFGEGDYLVAESDESDGSFVDLPSFIGAITNIEPEHLEFYDGDFNKVKDYYQRYIDQIPQDGLLLICIDDEQAKALYKKNKEKKNILSYGFDKNADIAASNITSDIDGQKFDIKIKKSNRIIENLKIPAYGIYNVSNSLIALGIADFFNFDDQLIKKSFSNFSGVQRRFTKVGQVNGAIIIDDYAHHPTEIKAILKAARNLVGNNKVIAVFQPHKYTRTRDLFEEFCSSFNDVDKVIIANIYSAGQDPIEGVNNISLANRVKQLGHNNVSTINGEEDLPEIINKEAKKGDIVICAGAGNITYWARNLEKNCQNV